MADLKEIFADVAPAIKKFGVVGYPLSHSLSPAMQQAAMDRLHMKAVYRAISVKPDEWKSFLEQAKAFPLNGFNITVPFKENLKHDKGFSAADIVSEITGSVNTAAFQEGRWKMFNTDAEGFAGDLSAQGMGAAGRSVVLLGAGGSARTILFSLGFTGKPPKHLTIVNRTIGKAEALLKDFTDAPLRKTDGQKYPVSVAKTDADVRLALAERDALVINATSLGLKAGDPVPVNPEWLTPGVDVYDLIYHRETELMAAAKKAGARKVSGGLGMLVRQGALAFEIWFGQKPPLDVMRQAAEAELERRKNFL